MDELYFALFVSYNCQRGQKQQGKFSISLSSSNFFTRVSVFLTCISEMTLESSPMWVLSWCASTYNYISVSLKCGFKI